MAVERMYNGVKGGRRLTSLTSRIKDIGTSRKSPGWSRLHNGVMKVHLSLFVGCVYFESSRICEIT